MYWQTRPRQPKRCSRAATQRWARSTQRRALGGGSAPGCLGAWGLEPPCVRGASRRSRTCLSARASWFLGTPFAVAHRWLPSSVRLSTTQASQVIS